MLYVEFDSGVTEQWVVEAADWTKHGQSIVWLLYDPDTIHYIERVLWLM